MEPLSGIDSNFLYLETPGVHMHTLKVAVMDARAKPGGLTYDAVVRAFARRLDRLPPFRRRLVEVPLGLSHPVWVEDSRLDLQRHLRHRRAEHPGGRHELCAIVSEIASRPLDRAHPLWEVTFVDGLAEGRVAFVAKIHHAIADGARALELLFDALDEGAASGWVPEPTPARRALLRRGLHVARERLRALPRLVLRTLAGLVALLRRPRTRHSRPPLLPAPNTCFNTTLGPERTFGVAELPLQALRDLRKRHDVTLNDVFLTLCSEMLRRYLSEIGGLPGRPLVVGVPRDTRDGRRLPGGNHVGHLIASLRTDIEDPVERLHAIHRELAEAKARDAALGEGLLESWAEFAPPRATARFMRAWSRWHMGRRLPPPINLVASNVRGPSDRLLIDGLPLESFASVGPILEGIGLNLTAWSYAGRLYLAALGCPETLPDPWKLLDHAEPALAALRGSLAPVCDVGTGCV